jgi:hypothetical protein
MPKERIDILNNDWFYSKYLDIILVIKYIFVSMVGVAKKKSKPNRNDTNPCFTSGIFYQHP